MNMCNSTTNKANLEVDVFRDHINRVSVFDISIKHSISLNSIDRIVSKLNKHFLRYCSAIGEDTSTEFLVPVVLTDGRKEQLLDYLSNYSNINKNMTLIRECQKRDEPSRCVSCMAFMPPNSNPEICPICISRLGPDYFYNEYKKSI